MSGARTRDKAEGLSAALGARQAGEASPMSASLRE
jgi:hypothetical protein